jgi:uncharacterized membrane protein YcaP (DUF421 family)
VEEVFHSMLRTCVSVFILMLLSLWAGKQINSHINHYNFALSITIGAFIANMSFDTMLKFPPMLAAFFTLIFIYFCFSFLSSKYRRFRMWISGQPTVIMEDGKILDRNMQKVRYTLDDLNQQLRELGVFDINEVEYALLEVSGKLSILKKAKYQGLTKEDVFPNAVNQDVIQPLELIMNGKIIEKNLNKKYSRHWLNEELNFKHLQLKEVQYAVISSNGNLFMDLYNDHIKSPIDKE